MQILTMNIVPYLSFAFSYNFQQEIFIMSYISEESTVSTKDPILYKEIMLIASDVQNQGFNLQGYKNRLVRKGLNISHENLVYKALQILVRARLLVRSYSTESKGIVYRLVPSSDACMV